MGHTLCWKTSIPTDVPPCREATKAENELKLRSVLEDMSHHTAIGAPDYGQTDMFFKYDSVSKKSSGVPGWKTDVWTCDTCQIRKKQSLVHRKVHLPRPHAPASARSRTRRCHCVRKNAWRLESAWVD